MKRGWRRRKKRRWRRKRKWSRSRKRKWSRTRKRRGARRRWRFRGKKPSFPPLVPSQGCQLPESQIRDTSWSRGKPPQFEVSISCVKPPKCAVMVRV